MANIIRLIDYVDKKRFVLYLISISMCLAIAYEAACTIRVKGGILSIEYSRFWSLAKDVRELPVSEIDNIIVTWGGGVRGCTGPQFVEIVNRRGDRLEFGTTLNGGGASLDGVAYEVESLLKQSIRTHQDVCPIRVFPNTIWNGVAFLIFLLGGLFFIWKRPKGLSLTQLRLQNEKILRRRLTRTVNCGQKETGAGDSCDVVRRVVKKRVRKERKGGMKGQSLLIQ